MPITLDELVVEIKADISALKNGMDRAKSEVKASSGNINKSVQGATASFFKWTLAIRAANMAWNGLKNALADVDRIAKNADAIGTTTEALSALQFAARLTGVSNEKFNRGMLIMARNLGETAMGTGEAKEALGELGLSISDLLKMRPDEQFAVISDSMSEIESANRRAALAADIFGRSGLELINLIKGGKATLDEARQLTDSYGTSLTRVDAKQIEQVNDAITEMNEAWRGTINQVVVALGPQLIQIIDFWTDSIQHLSKFLLQQQLNWTELGLIIVQFAQKFESELLGAVDSVLKGFNYLISAWNAIAEEVLGDTLKMTEFATNNARTAQGISAQVLKEMEASANETAGRINEIEEELASRQTARQNRRMKELVEVGQQQLKNAQEGPLGGGRDTDAELEFKKAQAELATQLLYDELSAEEQAIFESTEKRLQLYLDAHAKKLLTDEELYAKEREAYADKEAAISQIKDTEERARRAMSLDSANFIIDQLQSVVEAVGNSSDETFGIMKALRIAETVINTASSVMKIMAEAPLPAQPWMIGAAVAAGAAQVAKIASTSPSSGGTVGAAPSGVGAGQPELVQDVNIVLQGSNFSDETVRGLGERLGEMVEDGASIRGINVQ